MLAQLLISVTVFFSMLAVLFPTDILKSLRILRGLTGRVGRAMLDMKLGRDLIGSHRPEVLKN